MAQVYKLPPEGAGAELADLKAAEIPITITGPLADMKIRPDVAGLAKARVKQEVEKKMDEKKEELKEKLGDKLKGSVRKLSNASRIARARCASTRPARTVNQSLKVWLRIFSAAGIHFALSEHFRDQMKQSFVVTVLSLGWLGNRGRSHFWQSRWI